MRRGEIVGIAGVAGNGQKELFETLVGVRKPTAGSVLLDGQEITGLSPSEVQHSGVGHIPDDRFAEGLVPDFDIQSNLVLGAHREAPFSKNGILNKNAIREFSDRAIKEFSIKAPSAETICRTLSGGNAQKIIVAREFAQSSKVILANQPSRGLDVGVIEYMHVRFFEKRKEQFGILLASEELEELLALSDRILVIFKGKIVGEFAHDNADIEKIGLLMAGHSDDSSRQDAIAEKGIA
ncbi:ATP-binding cassette domain-containing protein [Rhodobacteraceae bacterium SC52]|nr:ATP-binding cassette domain-containing protein [Rhodobacteraceae bacterium SC52]